MVGGTIAGQTYELTFWYAPRADDGDADSSSMTVTWNGVLVHTINSANEPAGWQQITLQVTATGPNSVLGFGGTGQANELGAFIDNVSLRAMAVVLDDEDTDFGNDGISANDIGIQGGPGDDGQGVVENGQILFNAGSDGLKSIALVPLAGLSGVYVDPVTHLGTIHAITTAWVAGQNGAGGTAGYEKGGTLVGTMNVPSVGLVTAFTVEVQSDGTYKFTLLEPLAHPGHDDPSTNPAVESSFEDNLQLDFTVTVTDGDNDTATSTLSVNVDDDTPNLANVSFTLSDTMHDETVGVQNDPADLDAPLDTNVEHDVPVELTVFTDRTGAGEVLEFAGTAIGYAQNATAALVGVPVGAYGADGAGAAPELSLTTAGGGSFSGSATNLFDTQSGNRIFLYTDEDSGLVVGRVGTIVDAADPAGAIVFALALEDNGTVSIAQYRAIEHPDTTLRDEFVTLLNPSQGGILFVTATVTDGDGDIASNTSTSSLLVKFEDDGPTCGHFYDDVDDHSRRDAGCRLWL